MFFDFSSAFKHHSAPLTERQAGKDASRSHLVSWITDYLTGRPQYVRLKGLYVRDCGQQHSEELKAARHILKAGIRAAKHKYSSQIGAHFNTNSDPRRMWQEIQVITDYKSKAQISNTALFHTMEEEPPLILAANEVRKAAGPDGIPGRSLKACASQLAHTFTDIFNLSLAQSTVPVCFKVTTIIPIPKKPIITSPWTHISCL
ncbi:hypothetical protein NFI96_010064, partial [Prochilodus magdalenae]